MTVKSSPSTHVSNPVLNVAYIAVFAALIISLGFVSIPVGIAGVPIVLQNTAVILAGLVLGPRRGFLAVALFLGLGLLGLSVLAGGRSTLSALSGTTVGYLVGYLVAAFVAGLIAYLAPRGDKTKTITFLIIGSIVALCLQYLFGSIGLMIRSDMAFPAALAANIPYIIPDLVELIAVISIAFGVHQAFPDLRAKK